MNKELLYIHESEDIAQIIDKIERSENDNIFLNISESKDVFKNPINLKILKREVDFLGKDITLVSDDNDVLDFVKSAGFEVELEKTESITSSKDDYKAISLDEHLPLEDDLSDSQIEDIKQPDFLNKGSDELKDSPFGKELESDRDDYDDYDRDADVFFEKVKGGELENKDKKEKKNFLTKINFTTDFFGSLSSNKVLISLAFVFLIILFSAFFVFRPKADLNIMIKKETIDFTMPISADINLSKTDFDKARVPGQIIKLEKYIEKEFESTGESDGATKATGKLTIYNEYGSEPQPLVARTRFKTEDGKIFRITKRVVVPGAKMSGSKVVSPGVLEVDVVSDEVGSSQNIGPSNFVIPGFEGTAKFDAFYAKSVSSMSGGSSGDTKTISQNDIDKAKEELDKLEKEERAEYVKSNIASDFVFLSGAVKRKVEYEDVPVVGSGRNKFNLKAKFSYDVFVFKGGDVSELAERNLSLRIKDKRETYPETQSISYDSPIFSIDGSVLNFSVRVSEVVGGKIDENALRDSIAGKNEIDISKILNGDDSIESADIIFWPFWSDSAPDNPKKIKIKIIR